MATRCKACNTVLYDLEMTQKKEDEDGNFLEYEDMCNKCKTLSQSEFDYVEDHEYQHPDLEEDLNTVFSPKY